MSHAFPGIMDALPPEPLTAAMRVLVQQQRQLLAASVAGHDGHGPTAEGARISSRQERLSRTTVASEAAEEQVPAHASPSEAFPLLYQAFGEALVAKSREPDFRG